MTGAHITKRQNILRENLGKIFTLLTNLLPPKIYLIYLRLQASQWSRGQKTFSHSRLDDWSFDAEILF